MCQGMQTLGKAVPAQRHPIEEGKATIHSEEGGSDMATHEVCGVLNGRRSHSRDGKRSGGPLPRPSCISIFSLSKSQTDFAFQTGFGTPGHAVGKTLFSNRFDSDGVSPPPDFVASPLSRHVAEIDSMTQNRKYGQPVAGGQSLPKSGGASQLQSAHSPDTPRTRAFLKKIGGLAQVVDNAKQWEKNYNRKTNASNERKAGKFVFDMSVPRLPAKSQVVNKQPQLWDHQKSQQTENEILETFTQQCLRQDAQFKGGRLGQGRIQRLNERRERVKQQQRQMEKNQKPPFCINERCGQTLWGSEVHEKGKAHLARLQADFEEIKIVSELPDTDTSLNHAYIAAAHIYPKPEYGKDKADMPKQCPSDNSQVTKKNPLRLKRKKPTSRMPRDKPLPSYMRSTVATRLWEEQTKSEKMLPKEQRTSIY